MSKDPSTEAATVPKDARPLDVNAMELVFGTPNSPKMGFTVTPDVHSITNERTGKSPTENLNNNNRVNNKTDLKPSAPLLEPHIGKQNPPLAGPEVDDLDDRPADAGVDSFAGIDDGLLEPADKKPDIFHINGDKDKKDEDDPHATADEGVGTEDGKWLWPHDETDYPYDGVNGFENRFGVDDRAISPLPGTIPDVNTYQQKKNLAQGMMDLALLSANANQLRYVIESSSGGHPYYYSSIIFISLSIVLQIAVGIGLILNSRYNVKDDKDICKADKINNMTVLGVFLITIVNVFITSFSVAPSSTGAVTSVIQQAG